MSADSAPRTARARARAEITAEILAAARRQLAETGAAGLSLRQVARDLGMASSAVYRYVASRDELLTRLIVEAYDNLGAAAEAAEEQVPREDVSGRFAAVAVAVRRWARANPHEYALVYGTPVPGYRAPEDTIGPASRVPTLLITLLVDAWHRGHIAPAAPLAPEVVTAVGPIRTLVPPDLPDDLLVRGMLVWSALFGAVSFELFGHLHNVVADDDADREAFFDQQLRLMADLVGLP